MDHFSVSRRRRFHYRFADGRVGVYRFDDLVPGSFQFARHYHFGDHFRDIVSDKMGAKSFAVFFVKNDLDEAFRGAGGFRFARCGERKFTDQHFVTGLFGGLFSITDGGNFR